jgi:hypothetical protein
MNRGYFMKLRKGLYKPGLTRADDTENPWTLSKKLAVTWNFVELLSQTRVCNLQGGLPYLREGDYLHIASGEALLRTGLSPEEKLRTS